MYLFTTEQKGVATSGWSSTAAATSYGVSDWGRDLFDVSENGDVVMLPSDPHRDPISIAQIIEKAEASGVELPLVIRFPEIVKARVERFQNGFAKSIQSEEYDGGYRMVYPIKVNPEDGVIRTFLKANQGLPTGLEIGSKAELVCALHHLADFQDSVLVCNGKKDDEFITIALLAQQIGFNIVLVVESPGEISRILRTSESLRIKPSIGVRIQISETSPDLHNGTAYHETALFGLTIPELVEEIDILKTADKIDCLRLVHFHNGSLSKDRDKLRNAIVEISQLYISLVREGAPLEMLDIGGGVPVVGIGQPQSGFEEHPIDWLPDVVIKTVTEVFADSGVPHPEIITESGRAVLAHSSVLVFDIVGTSRSPSAIGNPKKSQNELLRALASDLARAHDSDSDSARDVLGTATHHRESLTQDFRSGDLSLRERAEGERMFHEILRRLATTSKDLREELSPLIADIDCASVSIFRSIPDIWGLGEVFPTLPIRGLQTAPTRSVMFRDLTCDPDGMIDLFYWNGDMVPALPIPRSSGPARMGTFLLGAYQEIIGSSHNLMGRTYIYDVHSSASPDGFDLHESVKASTVSDMVTRVNTIPSAVVDSLCSAVENAFVSGKITEDERQSAIKEFGAFMKSSTYFKP